MSELLIRHGCELADTSQWVRTGERGEDGTFSEIRRYYESYTDGDYKLVYYRQTTI